ncbi:MAG: hypothetical protein QNJ40_04115 [Xanthomonadales bacterium]|nr:hypothetical protein [Xanthomonadales bacterium]
MRETKYWALNLLAGLLILVLLAQHMAVMQLDGWLEKWLADWIPPLSWPGLVERGTNLIQMVSYVLLLGLGLFHGFYGLNKILAEFIQGDQKRRIIRLGCTVMGILLFVVGTTVTVGFYLVNG